MRTILFLTHTTLTPRHAALCFSGLVNQTEQIWDRLILYNSHQGELPNQYIIDLAREMGLSIPIEIFPYNEESPKTLVADVLNLREYARGFDDRDTILVIKSEYVLSRGFNAAVKGLDNSTRYLWCLPGTNAKQFVTDEEIMEYQAKMNFVYVDDKTYYRGSDLFSPKEENGPVVDGLRLRDTDYRIHFVSHRANLDWGVHVMPAMVWKDFPAHHKRINWSWGGLAQSLSHCHRSGMAKFLDIDSAFAIHVFHEIISKNRVGDRIDMRKCMPGQKY